MVKYFFKNLYYTARKASTFTVFLEEMLIDVSYKYLTLQGSRHYNLLYNRVQFTHHLLTVYDRTYMLALTEVCIAF